MRCESVSVSIGSLHLERDQGVVELLEAGDLIGHQRRERRLAGPVGLVAGEFAQGAFDRRELVADAVDLKAELVRACR